MTHGMVWRQARGLSLAEMLVAVSLASLAGVVGVPALSHVAGSARDAAAARYVATALQATRVEAARRGVQVAVRFDAADAGFTFRRYADGNANGVRSSDMARGIDVALAPEDSLTAHFGGVDFRVVRTVPGIDGGPAVTAGSHPIRLGSASLASWSPGGSATSGTLYLGSHRGVQYAVRILGVTGRIRVFRFDGEGTGWRPL